MRLYQKIYKSVVSLQSAWLWHDSDSVEYWNNVIYAINAELPSGLEYQDGIIDAAIDIDSKKSGMDKFTINCHYAVNELSERYTITVKPALMGGGFNLSITGISNQIRDNLKVLFEVILNRKVV